MSYSIRRGTPPNTKTTMRLTTQDTVAQARALIAGGDLDFRIFNSRGEPVKLTDLERVLELAAGPVRLAADVKCGGRAACK